MADTAPRSLRITLVSVTFPLSGKIRNKGSRAYDSAGNGPELSVEYVELSERRISNGENAAATNCEKSVSIVSGCGLVDQCPIRRTPMRFDRRGLLEERA